MPVFITDSRNCLLSLRQVFYAYTNQQIRYAQIFAQRVHNQDSDYPVRTFGSTGIQFIQVRKMRQKLFRVHVMENRVYAECAKKNQLYNRTNRKWETGPENDAEFNLLLRPDGSLLCLSNDWECGRTLALSRITNEKTWSKAYDASIKTTPNPARRPRPILQFVKLRMDKKDAKTYTAKLEIQDQMNVYFRSIKYWNAITNATAVEKARILDKVRM